MLNNDPLEKEVQTLVRSSCRRLYDVQSKLVADAILFKRIRKVRGKIVKKALI